MKKRSQKKNLISFLLLMLSLEKTVQHVFVSMALLYDFGSIRSTVAVDYRALAVSGAIIAVLFVVSFFAVLLKKGWAVYLLAAIAAFDVIGEFVAQGTFTISVNVSILVAAILLILCSLQLRNIKKAGKNHKVS
jgi:hypothetical protein